MPYNTNGGSHRDGVSNEKKIVAHLNASNGASLNLPALFGQEGLQFIQIGGTKSVSDMDILSSTGAKVCGVSIKNHKQGSYDYVNTSKLQRYLPDIAATSIKGGIVAIREKYKGDESKVEQAKKEVEDILVSGWEFITSDVLKSILQAINVRNPKLVMINDIKDKKLKCYHESSFTELSAEPYKATNTYDLKSTRAKGSRQITRNGVNTNLRIRIVLNNGVEALLDTKIIKLKRQLKTAIDSGVNAEIIKKIEKKIKTVNRNSSVTIKIQQDKVNDVLKSTTLYSQCDFQ